VAENIVIKDRMELPQAPADVFAFVTDLDAVAPCVPGAKLDPQEEGQPADAPRNGEVVMAFGPIRYRYRGTIQIRSTDAATRTVEYDASGSETSGEGTLGVDMTLRVTDGDAGGSALDVVANARLTGMIADYGQGMAEEVAKDIISQFVRAVKGRDLGTNASAAVSADGKPAATTQPAPVAPAKAIGGFRLLVRALMRRVTRKLRGAKGKKPNG
jgi:carbon monoxide dehydrogenase subunit G